MYCSCSSTYTVSHIVKCTSNASIIQYPSRNLMYYYPLCFDLYFPISIKLCLSEYHVSVEMFSIIEENINEFTV